MTAYAATNVNLTAGALVPPRTGTAAADTVPAGALVVWRNTGAGAHTVTLTNNFSYDGATISAKVITMAAGEVWVSRIRSEWADSSGNVGVAINGTAAEVIYYILGNV
jgi:hypothetical protein